MILLSTAAIVLGLIGVPSFEDNYVVFSILLTGLLVAETSTILVVLWSFIEITVHNDIERVEQVVVLIPDVAHDLGNAVDVQGRWPY